VGLDGLGSDAGGTRNHEAISFSLSDWLVGVNGEPSKVHAQQGIFTKPEQAGVDAARNGIHGVSSSA